MLEPEISALRDILLDMDIPRSGEWATKLARHIIERLERVGYKVMPVEEGDRG